MPSVNFGVYLDNRMAVLEGPGSMDKLLAMAPRAEQLGYGSVWVGDSPLAKPRFWPESLLSAVASLTDSIRIGTSILQPHLRNPVWLAESWATVDIISHGRTIMGAGLGNGPLERVVKEYLVAGLPKNKRGQVFEECIELIRKLWTEGEVNFSGSYYNLQGISLGYKPVQKPHPPIWIASGIFIPNNPGFGSTSDHWTPRKAGAFAAVNSRVAKLGDGWLTTHATPDEYQLSLRQIREWAAKFGREPGSIHPALLSWMNIREEAARAKQEGKAVLEQYHSMRMDEGTLRRTCFGTVEDAIRWVESYRSAGARTVILVFRSLDQVAQMELFAKEVMPCF